MLLTNSNRFPVFAILLSILRQDTKIEPQGIMEKKKKINS